MHGQTIEFRAAEDIGGLSPRTRGGGTTSVRTVPRHPVSRRPCRHNVIPAVHEDSNPNACWSFPLQLQGWGAQVPFNDRKEVRIHRRAAKAFGFSGH